MTGALGSGFWMAASEHSRLANIAPAALRLGLAPLPDGRLASVARVASAKHLGLCHACSSFLPVYQTSAQRSGLGCRILNVLGAGGDSVDVDAFPFRS